MIGLDRFTMGRGLILGACVLAGCVAAGEPLPVETFEGELVLGTLGSSAEFVPYVIADDGAYVVEVVRGFQGADMVVIVVELPDEYGGQRVDFACRVETEHWSSNLEDARLQDILVGTDRLLYAPYVILGWWDGQDEVGSVTCEVSGPTRADLTTIDARLTKAVVAP
jgi:hypothetical protein